LCERAPGTKTRPPEDRGASQPFSGASHNRLGHGDWFQMADATTGLGGGVSGGIIGLSAGYTGNFSDRHEIGAAFWDYKLEEDNGGDDKLGTAIDVWYGFNYSRNVTFLASLSQLSPDDALTGAGPDDSVYRIYGQARLRF